MRTLCLLALAGCIATANTPRVIVLPPMALGRTDCVDGVPVSVIRGGMRPADSAEVDAHEARHRIQMAGRCNTYLRLFQGDIVFAVRMELDAYCVGIATRPPDERPMRREQLLAYVRRSGLPDVVIARLYAEVCP